MKATTLVAATLLIPMLVSGCLRDESFPELGMMFSAPEAVASSSTSTSPESLIASAPTAAGLESTPVWKTLSYSENLADAYDERVVAGRSVDFDND